MHISDGINFLNFISYDLPEVNTKNKMCYWPPVTTIPEVPENFPKFSERFWCLTTWCIVLYLVSLMYFEQYKLFLILSCLEQFEKLPVPTAINQGE